MTMEICRCLESSNKVNAVLFFKVNNSDYPISMQLLHAICSQYGQVLRIVILKSGNDAMVEFDNVKSAALTLNALERNNRSMETCIWKVDYAKTTKLNVYKNDASSWDYTKQLSEETACPTERPKRLTPLLENPIPGVSPQLYGGKSETLSKHCKLPVDKHNSNNIPFGLINVEGGYGNKRIIPAFVDSHHLINSTVPLYVWPLSSTPPRHSRVMMVYNLDLNNFNPDKLFNIFCLYGNVDRIQFFTQKQDGGAMVQMHDHFAVERCIDNLNHMLLFGTAVRLGYSKQQHLNNVPNPFVLPDQSLSFKNFIGDHNNRFSDPAKAAGKNRILRPSRILHFFNAPLKLRDDVLEAVLRKHSVVFPKAIVVFPPSEKSSSGLMEFASVADALHALMMCNNTTVSSPVVGSRNNHILKLCFSSSRHIPVMHPKDWEN